MATITCSRCHRETEGFGKPPLPGQWGEEVQAHSCEACFQDWMNTEIMIINEYRLDLSVPRNQDLLNAEMAKFLSLPSAPPAESAPPA